MMSRKVKQYKPIGFGDSPDPGTVEGHRKDVREAAERREYNRTMKELQPGRETRQGGLLIKYIAPTRKGQLAGDSITFFAA